MFFSNMPPVRATKRMHHETEETNLEDEPEDEGENLEDEEANVFTKIREDGVTDIVCKKLQAAKEEEIRRQGQLEEYSKELA
jgi:hypothetical protein